MYIVLTFAQNTYLRTSAKIHFIIKTALFVYCTIIAQSNSFYNKQLFWFRKKEKEDIRWNRGLFPTGWNWTKHTWSEIQVSKFESLGAGPGNHNGIVPGESKMVFKSIKFDSLGISPGTQWYSVSKIDSLGMGQFERRYFHILIPFLYIIDRILFN